MRSNFYYTLCLAACLGVSAGTNHTTFPRSSQNARTTPTKTTITELVDHAETFNGKRVQVSAVFVTDGIERSVLLEPNCNPVDLTKVTPNHPQCNRGINPWIADGVEHHPDIEAFDRALGEGMRSTADKHVVATFTGRFICKPSCSARGGRVLEIEKIENLEVTPIETRPHLPH
jgi:hypothetical protein